MCVSVRVCPLKRMVDVGVQTDPLPALPPLTPLPKEVKLEAGVPPMPEGAYVKQQQVVSQPVTAKREPDVDGPACVPCANPPAVRSLGPDYSASDSDGESNGDDNAPDEEGEGAFFDASFGDRPWRCAEPGCGKGFRARALLKQHRQQKHNVDVVWWPCDYCDVAVKRKSHLASHLAWCHDIYDRPYPCAFPGCTFVGKLKNHLTQHIRKSHTPRPARRPVGRPGVVRPLAAPAAPAAAVVNV